jgi:hypothetical protein
MGGEKSDLPPRLRNWQKGKPQIGVFLRTRVGSTITLINNTATDNQETLALAFIVGVETIPLEVMTPLRKWIDQKLKRSDL